MQPSTAKLLAPSPPHRLLPPRPMGTRVSHPFRARSAIAPSTRCRAPSPPHRLTPSPPA